jgi:hypothetical protein
MMNKKMMVIKIKKFLMMERLNLKLVDLKQNSHKVLHKIQNQFNLIKMDSQLKGLCSQEDKMDLHH